VGRPNPRAPYGYAVGRDGEGFVVRIITDRDLHLRLVRSGEGRKRPPHYQATYWGARQIVDSLNRAKPNPPDPGVQIYPASSGVALAGMKKGAGHPCDAACRAAGHRYIHDFTTDVEVIGKADGSVALRPGSQ
jgi:hypothetical protein